jgi:phenylpropionate dioxygenase-like ring-hydroxylating dioxygenase large terminal subunit
MIRSSIPPIAYIDPAWFEKERKLFFEPLWQFATLKTLFKEENSYIALDILGREVVIQTINGKLQAFENTCLHRQNRLQEKGIGNRPLVCQYHGWTYGENGDVSHIPFQQEYYQIKKEEITNLHRNSSVKHHRSHL